MQNDPKLCELSWADQSPLHPWAWSQHLLCVLVLSYDITPWKGMWWESLLASGCKPGSEKVENIGQLWGITTVIWLILLIIPSIVKNGQRFWRKIVAKIYQTSEHLMCHIMRKFYVWKPRHGMRLPNRQAIQDIMCGHPDAPSKDWQKHEMRDIIHLCNTKGVVHVDDAGITCIAAMYHWWWLATHCIDIPYCTLQIMLQTTLWRAYQQTHNILETQCTAASNLDLLQEQTLHAWLKAGIFMHSSVKLYKKCMRRKHMLYFNLIHFNWLKEKLVYKKNKLLLYICYAHHNSQTAHSWCLIHWGEKWEVATIYWCPEPQCSEHTNNPQKTMQMCHRFWTESQAGIAMLPSRKSSYNWTL